MADQKLKRKNEANSPSPSPSEISDAEQVLRHAAEEAQRLQAKRELKPGVQPLPGTLATIESSKLPDPNRDRIVRLDEARQKQAMIERLVLSCGVPKRYRDAELLNAKLVPFPSRADYLEKFNRLQKLFDATTTIALIGGRGTGKTHMACAIVNEFCRRGRYALYVEAMDYFIALQESYDDESKRRASVIETHHLKPELLVIDAVEERADTPWNDRMFTRLVNKRYGATVATLLISNHTRKAFAERVGESIADRLNDEGGIIECAWKSLRGNLIRAMRDATEGGSL